MRGDDRRPCGGGDRPSYLLSVDATRQQQWRSCLFRSSNFRDTHGHTQTSTEQAEEGRAVRERHHPHLPAGMVITLLTIMRFFIFILLALARPFGSINLIRSKPECPICFNGIVGAVVLMTWSIELI